MKLPILLALLLPVYPALAQTPPLFVYVLQSPDEEADGQFGEAVGAIGGDVDADGVPDLIVGARSEDPDMAFINSGQAHLYSGAAGSLISTLTSPNPEYWGFFGSAVDGIGGDVNGDGIFDVLVGAPYEDPGSSPTDAGRAYVFSGADGALIHTIQSPIEENGSQFGTVVAGLRGDVNGDGIADFLVSQPYASPLGSPYAAGRVHVFSGATGLILYSIASPMEESVSLFGWTASAIGDADSDGLPDIIVGAYLEDPGTAPSNAGRAHVYSGATGALIATLVSPNEEKDGYFGRSVSGAGGDLNGDGSDDVLVGAFWENLPGDLNQAGRAYAFNGADGAPLLTLESPNPYGAGWFGSSVAGPGTDANGDGIVDLLVGAPQEGEDAGLNIQSGRAHLFSGVDGSLLQTLVSPYLESDGWLGSSLAGEVGDLDGDGIKDMFIGAERTDLGFFTNAGGAFVFSGSGFICDYSQAPTQQQHTLLANRAVLSWLPQAGAVGCQLQAKRLPTGPTPSANVVTDPYSSFSVPYAVAGPGSTWTWRVRCACNLSPLEATPYSNYVDTFHIPVAREAQTDLLANMFMLSPNPVQQELTVAGAEMGSPYQIFDLAGKMVQSGLVQTQFSVAALPTGWYTLVSGQRTAAFIKND
ncbi:MAG: hypothetical protein GC205_10330 [Bacteroidetes bacterium]|nr:hypothetical protein [Bacteroidota bacterium]